jgi:hypothetical protein
MSKITECVKNFEHILYSGGMAEQTAKSFTNAFALTMLLAVRSEMPTDDLLDTCEERVAMVRKCRNVLTDAIAEVEK